MYCPCFLFVLGQFVRATKSEKQDFGSVIGWRNSERFWQPITKLFFFAWESHRQIVVFALSRANKFAWWKTGLKSNRLLQLSIILYLLDCRLLQHFCFNIRPSSDLFLFYRFNLLIFMQDIFEHQNAIRTCKHTVNNGV